MRSGNVNCSAEEVVRGRHSRRVSPGASWSNHRGEDVAPSRGFQGQEAPVVLYSLATSNPEDAPRGFDFLFSLNRLNVATSRAQAIVVLVASPRLLEAQCKTPKQMRLVNAFCGAVTAARGTPV
jgi:hypothetical protein